MMASTECTTSATRAPVARTLALLTALPVVLALPALALGDSTSHISGSRIGPSTAETLAVARGERVAFSALGADNAGDLWAAEWYLDGHFLGAQYVSQLSAGDGGSAVFWRGINFPALGTSVVEAQPFDRAGNYAAPVRWTVRVQERPRLLYLDRTDERLATDSGIAEIRALVARHHFNLVAIYRLPSVLSNGARTERLRKLVRGLHADGVRGVFAVVVSPAVVTAVESYLGAAGAGERFDGLLSEFEFWQPGFGWRDYLRLLAHMRVLADREGLLVATYLGWPESRQIQGIVGLVDLVLLHAYVKDPAVAYNYLESRLELFAGQLSAPITVWPILSADPSFMGNWLANSVEADAVERAERMLLDSFRDDRREYRNGLRLGGFAWFSASLLEAALP